MDRRFGAEGRDDSWSSEVDVLLVRDDHFKRYGSSFGASMESYQNWDGVVIGIWVGISLSSSLWALFTWLAETREDAIAESHGGLRLFGILGLVCLTCWGFCAQLAVWREARVNYAAVFGIPRRWFPRTDRMILFTARSTTIYFVSMIAFLKLLQNGYLGANWIPLMLMTIVIFLTIVAVASMNVSVRAICIGFSGIGERSFLMGYTCDYATSTARIGCSMARVGCDLLQPNPLKNLAHGSSICEQSLVVNEVVVPILMCWPLWVRFLQSLFLLYETNELKYALNALKYALSNLIVITTTFDTTIGFWVFEWCFVGTSFFSFVWDVKMDWGLNFCHLRDRLHYPEKWYHMAISADFLMRIVWSLTLINNWHWRYEFGWLLQLFGALEIVRRSFWGIIRVEQEHITKRHAALTPLLPLADGAYSSFFAVFVELVAISIFTLTFYMFVGHLSK